MIIYLLCALLFVIGLCGVIIQRSLIKIIIGICIMEYAINLFFVLIGYKEGGVAPIITKGENLSIFVDPLPQALVLTTIVIGLGTTALLVSIAIRIYHKHGTFDINKIKKLKG